MTMSGQTTLAGAVVLVTGAGQPLGDAIAQRLGEAGARLALVHLPEDEAAAQRLQSETGAALALACDPRDPEAVRGAVRAVAAQCGGLDALVTATVARVRGSARTLPFEEWARVIDVELSGSLSVATEPHQVAWLRAQGAHASDVRERCYFRSIYFHAPDGLLLEIATDGPGFMVDEPRERLGTELRVPAWLGERREEIEATLTPLR